MTYKELIELYKQGKLEEKQKKEVEVEIEKQEAISEYLFDRDELNSFDKFINEENSSSSNDDSENFIKMINRSIRRAFIKFGIVVIVLMMAIVLFIQFALPDVVSELSNVVSSHYYNPDKEVAANTNQISLDMAVYTELFIPQNRRSRVSVTDEGYGNYEFIIRQESSYNGIFTDVSGKINRNKITFYNPNIISRPSFNIFEWSNPEIKLSKPISEQYEEIRKGGREDDIAVSAAGTPEEVKDEINSLKNDEEYCAYISLDRIMEYDDFVEFIEQYGALEVWCAPIVCEGEYNRPEEDNIGFNYSTLGMHSIEWDRKKYPNLLMWNYYEVLEDGCLKSEEQAIRHFTDMIRYMKEQEEFCDMMGISDYEEIAQYVEKNGLKIHGFYTVTGKKKLKKFIESEQVYTLYIEDAN